MVTISYLIQKDYLAVHLDSIDFFVGHVSLGSLYVVVRHTNSNDVDMTISTSMV